jgi:hypothetical protein
MKNNPFATIDQSGAGKLRRWRMTWAGSPPKIKLGICRAWRRTGERDVLLSLGTAPL